MALTTTLGAGGRCQVSGPALVVPGHGSPVGIGSGGVLGAWLGSDQPG